VIVKVLPAAPAAPCGSSAARSAAQLMPAAAHTLGSSAVGLCLLLLPAPSPSREGQQQRQPWQQHPRTSSRHTQKKEK
jgi:hypothetical protein